MSNLQALIKDRIDALNMQTHSSIIDYMIGEKYISENDVTDIYNEIILMDTNMDRRSIIFEIAAFNIGLIAEETLIEIITKYRGSEVVQSDEMSEMEGVFKTFNKDMCRKYSFFEYQNKTNSGARYMICSFATADKVSSLIKRNIEDFRIRYSIPAIINEKLDQM